MKNSKNIQDLFRGFLDGTLAPAELPGLYHHFGVTDEQELRALIEAAMVAEQEEVQAEQISQKHLDAIYSQIDRRIVEEVQPLPVRSRVIFPVFLKYAASVVLVVSVAWAVITMFDLFRNDIQWSKVATGYQRKKIVLPDGSEIWLAPQSSLEFPEKFASDKRFVKLNGEAFFEVTKDATRPFSIQSGELTTQVLGTSFNINAYDTERSATVTVLTGKVSVATESGPSGAIKLLPFQQAVVQSGSRKIVMREYPDANQLLLRREGNIRYAGARLADIIRDIQRISPYRIVAGDALENCLFYGEMKAGDDPIAFLENVCRVNNLTLKKQNETLISVTGKGCGR